MKHGDTALDDGLGRFIDRHQVLLARGLRVNGRDETRRGKRDERREGNDRLAHHLDFPDYGTPELMHIAQTMLTEQHYRLSPSALQAFEQYLELRQQQPHFANARSVRNALDRARLRQASRLFADRDRVLSEADLCTLEASDILASRLFAAAP